MNNALFEMYCKTQGLIKKLGLSDIPEVEDRELADEWYSAIQAIEDISPHYKERYDRLIKNQESFTPEQVDFICYQIGDWYIEWKDRIVIDLMKGTHRLGYAKEQLKTLICGE